MHADNECIVERIYIIFSRTFFCLRMILKFRLFPLNSYSFNKMLYGAISRFSSKGVSKKNLKMSSLNSRLYLSLPVSSRINLCEPDNCEEKGTEGNSSNMIVGIPHTLREKEGFYILLLLGPVPLI